MNIMWPKAIILLLVLNLFHVTSSSTCGVGLSPTLPDKIVGGRNAEEGEFPWQASLQKLTWLGFYHTCGASLVTSEWLVTAAHCFQKNTADSYRIMIGNNNLTAVTEDQNYLIKMIIIKQGYDPLTFHNDIALIKLFRPVPNFLTPICLTVEAAEANSTAVVTGWGATTDGGKASPYLQAANVIIIPRNECLAYYQDLTESMTCAGYDEGGIDACQGDSGGPLLQWKEGQAFFVGIVSWGIGCAEPGHPGVYTDVIQFNAWIRSYVESARLYHVKAHAGIAGNELADRLAREASLDSTDEVDISVSKSHVVRILKCNLLKEWQHLWFTSEKGRHTFSLLPKVGFHNYDFASLYSAFLSGHGLYLMYLERFHIKNTALCPCGELGTVLHYYLDCSLTSSHHLKRLIGHMSSFGHQVF